MLTDKMVSKLQKQNARKTRRVLLPFQGVSKKKKKTPEKDKKEILRPKKHFN